MNTNNAEVSSQALQGLRNNLASLSKQIHGICDTLNSDRNRVGEAWRDSKFQEFKNGFQRQIDSCEKIAEDYETIWCKQVLDPAIEKVQKIEAADVVGDGSGSAIGGNGSAVGGGVAAASAAARTASIASEFNKGGGARKVVSRPSTKANPSTTSGGSNKGVISGTYESVREYLFGPKLSKQDEACQTIRGKDYHAVDITDPNDPNIIKVKHSDTSKGGQYKVGASAEAGVEAPIYGVVKGEAKAGVHGEYSSGSDSTTDEYDFLVKCEKENNQ